MIWITSGRRAGVATTVGRWCAAVTLVSVLMITGRVAAEEGPPCCYCIGTGCPAAACTDGVDSLALCIQLCSEQAQPCQVGAFMKTKSCGQGCGVGSAPLPSSGDS